MAGKYRIWTLLCIPAVWILWRYASDTINYGQVIHETGDWSFGFLFAALAVTPAQRLFPRHDWPRSLLRQRRALGVASFGYAALHTLVYLERKWGYGYIQQEALQPGLLTGWLALAIYLALAVTSNNASVRALKGGWKRLHRFVYFGAILVFAHWILTAVEPTTAYLCAAALCLVEALRFLRR
jgi:methionine sulfoxide reductase heme-binding subunit